MPNVIIASQTARLAAPFPDSRSDDRCHHYSFTVFLRSNQAKSQFQLLLIHRIRLVVLLRELEGARIQLWE